LAASAVVVFPTTIASSQPSPRLSQWLWFCQSASAPGRLPRWNRYAFVNKPRARPASPLEIKRRLSREVSSPIASSGQPPEGDLGRSTWSAGRLTATEVLQILNTPRPPPTQTRARHSSPLVARKSGHRGSRIRRHLIAPPHDDSPSSALTRGSKARNMVLFSTVPQNPVETCTVCADGQPQ